MAGNRNKFGVSRNGVACGEASAAVREQMSSFLTTEVPRGAYTAMRTSRKRSAVFLLDFHKKRLVDSHRILLAKDENSASFSDQLATTEESFLQLAVKSISASIYSLNELLEKGEEDREAMVTVVVTLSEPYEVHALASLLPDFREGGIGVEVRTGPRSRPKAKDTQWAITRKHWENIRLPGVEETILADEDGHLLEGATSNLFIFIDDVLYTAPDVILPGHLREAIIDRVCPMLDIPLRMEAPTLESSSRWQGGFITNARRLLDVVSFVKVPEVEGAPEVNLQTTQLTRQIRAQLAALVEDSSDPISTYEHCTSPQPKH
eukprot:CAMPEP_0113969844 /NCGR_PEP_ID=MMETSP0011_2-20120614/10632_1 /TAXON_ID=101924 /ORGANISM="Rhodosorus marinus" /LENGTH=319 /DNA_ID=CAMNT_0000983725 /DNA_START=80 /DNA_END=1039 /DNA_ORIENTATION=+ /assembly_acc=CAM_ASM_000156